MSEQYRIYDPLTDLHPPAGHDQTTTSYWKSLAVNDSFITSQSLPANARWLIIGAGYTGLNAALELVERGEKDIVVVDAGQPGAGCSSRNAGFILPASGRLSVADYQQKYSLTFGNSIAQAVLNEFSQGVEQVLSNVERYRIDCDLAQARYLRIAHNCHQSKALQSHADPAAAWPRRFITQADFNHQFPGIRHAYGALEQIPAARVQPLALAQGLAKALADNVTLVADCPLIQWQSTDNSELLFSKDCTIQAEKVLLCTNAYIGRQLYPALSQRQLPVLSSVLVTAPLSAQQRAVIGLSDTDLIMDTRLLKYYYRLLPDGRLLFGGRGAITGRYAKHPRYLKQLYKAMIDTLPALDGIQVDFNWHGWVSVTLDSIPRVFAHNARTFASFGYCGAGIAFSSLAGRRLAQLALGDKLPDLPFYQPAPPRFPFARTRRTGQRLFYSYARLRDSF